MDEDDFNKHVEALAVKRTRETKEAEIRICQALV